MTEPVSQPLRGLRVLVAEDEYLIADTLREDLEHAGAIVLGPVPSIDDAVELIAVEPRIDAAVLDLNLGGDLIFPVADRLAEKGVPFVFATGYDELSVPTRYAHVIRCEKPVPAAALTDALLRAISR